MRFYRLALITGILLLSLSVASAEEASDKNSLPPEKTRIIYEALLPLEDDSSGLADEAVVHPLSSETSDIKMAVEKVEETLQERNITLQGSPGQRQFLYEGMQIFLLIDSEHNRIRLVTPLARLDLLRRNPDFNEVELLQKMLKANYLATGDVRLCLNNHVIWVAFLHPLDSLTGRDLQNALGQLVEVVRKTREAAG